MLKPITTCRNMARNYGYRTFFMNLRVKNELSFIEKKNKYGTTSKNRFNSFSITPPLLVSLFRKNIYIQPNFLN